MIRKFKTGILVRDNMIQKMEAAGVNPHYRIIEGEEYITCLRNKIIEEATELAQEHDRAEIIKEMADVKEVLFYLQKAFDITEDELQKAQDKKRLSNGAFEKKFYTDYVEIEEGNSEIKRYANRPEKYPEI